MYRFARCHLCATPNTVKHVHAAVSVSPSVSETVNQITVGYVSRSITGAPANLRNNGSGMEIGASARHCHHPIRQPTHRLMCHNLRDCNLGTKSKHVTGIGLYCCATSSNMNLKIQCSVRSHLPTTDQDLNGKMCDLEIHHWIWGLCLHRRN